MSSYVRAVSISYIVLVCLSCVASDLRFALIPCALASLVLFVVGLGLFRRWTAAFAIPWPASKDDRQVVFIIEDTSCSSQGYDQELMIGLQVSRFAELGATVVLAVVSLYAMLFATISIDSLLRQSGFFIVEFIAGVGWIVLMANLRWFNEQLVLRRSYVTIAPILSRDPGFFRRGISYQFFDQNHERRGGRGPLWGRGRDSAVIVFYDPDEPDNNAPHGAFLFHRFVLALIPKRQR